MFKISLSNIISRLAVLMVLFLHGIASATGVPDSAEKVHPLLVGAKIPNVVVRDIKGKNLHLGDLVGTKPAIIIFYRGGWCPYCNIHLYELKEIESQLIELGYQIIVLSPDQPSELEKSIKKHSPRYTLLSDSEMSAAKGFGIAFKLNETILTKYKKFNIDLEAASGKKHQLLPVPSVFIVGSDQVIHFKYVNPDYKVRLKKEILLSAAKAYLK